MLNCEYQLPFVVVYPTEPFFSSGRNVTVVVRLQDGLGVAAVERVAALMDLFVRFANTGGLAGKLIEPWHSGVSSRPAVVQVNQVSVRLERCHFDDAALVALCVLFLHTDNVSLLASLEVQTGSATQRLSCDPNSPSSYPLQFGRIPFEIVDEEPETGTFMFTLLLAAGLEGSTQALLQELFDTWTGFILAGGFALAPIPPEATYVEPDNPLVHYETTVEWTVFKHRADPASIDALLNIIAAFHGRVRRVLNLTIT